MAEFVLPDFLKGNSADEIHKRMMDELPDDIDKGEGGFPWDFTRPTALEKAYFTEFQMAEAIKNMFPMWAYGSYLDYHGETRGIYRRLESHSKVELTITGVADTIIPAGFQVSTEATLDEPAVIFSFDEETTIPASGIVKANVTAVEGGAVGNVIANSIVLQVKPMKGITTITNAEASYGGFAGEDDESLRSRIMEYDAGQDHSFVGSINDYKRWALSVTGVGDCKVIPPTDSSGKITLIITDANGQLASEDLRNAVYDYIMSPDAPYERLAPINASLEVLSPSALEISIIIDEVQLEDGYTLDMVRADFVKNMVDYFKNIRDSVIRRNDAIGVFVNTAGVIDFSNLIINDKSSGNITIDEYEIPTITVDSVELLSGKYTS